MTVENIPWTIQGGKHSAASGRRVLYKATGGAEGIASRGDLIVKQAAVANGTVIVKAGGATMVSRYPGVAGESYDGQNLSDTVVNIAANGGGSTRYDLVIARIDDWNFAGQQAVPATLPTDTVAAFKLTTIQGVGAAVKTTRELGLAYPAIALARIAIPAGTSAVTQAMITDLREVAVPRRKRDLRVVAQKAGRNNTLFITTPAGEQFPNDGVFAVEIPEWATQLKVQAILGGIVILPGTAYGALWVRVGHGRADVINTEQTLADFTSPKSDPSRITTYSGATVSIPATMRGQSVTVLLMGRKLGGTVNLGADASTSMSLDMEFVEAASEDL